MPKIEVNQYDVLVFDCYGTLVDWQTAITSYLQSVLSKHDAHVTDEFLLEFHAEWEPIEQEAGGKYRDVLFRLMHRLGDRLAFTPSETECEQFVQSLARSQPFDDVNVALAELGNHFELAIVSNTDREIIKKTLEPIDAVFEYVITAEDTGAYKPSEKMWQSATSLIGDEKRKLHVAQSLYHDVEPANKLGNDSVWINRDNQAGSAVRPSNAKPSWTFEDLHQMVDSL